MGIREKNGESVIFHGDFTDKQRHIPLFIRPLDLLVKREAPGYGASHLAQSRPNSIVPKADPLIGGQRFKAHRAAGVQLLGADRDFCAQAELPAVREAR